MKGFLSSLEVKHKNNWEQKRFQFLQNQINELFGPTIYLNQFEINRENLIKFFFQILNELNSRIEKREGKPFKGNYRKLSNIPEENLILFKELKSKPDQFERFFQMQIRKGLERLHFWNSSMDLKQFSKVNLILEEACKIFSVGLNVKNMSLMEIFLSNNLNKLE